MVGHDAFGATIDVACESLIVAAALDTPDEQSASAPLRRLSLFPDRTASGERAGAQRPRGLPGVADLRNADSVAIETASSATDCTRGSAAVMR